MRRGNCSARSPAVVASVLVFLLFVWSSDGGGKGAPPSGRAGGGGSSPHKHASDDAVRGKRERLTASARSLAATPKRHTRARVNPSRGVDGAEIAPSSTSAAGSLTALRGNRAKGREARQGSGRQGAPASFEDEEGAEAESDTDEHGLGFDRFDDDGFDEWLDDDDGSDGWSEDEDDEEMKLGRGWKSSSGKSGTQKRAAGLVATTVRDRLNSARQRASRAYREAKSLMSSEMEGVVLKATRPDDLPVKPKHLEALMRPTAEMPKEFNVYLPVVRKLWGKMTDKEWRVAVKALYVVHRFAADGDGDHAINLKESVAVLRTHHDSRRKVNYFDMGTICDVKAPPWSGEDAAPFSEFLRAYAEFVLYRTTHFVSGFGEVLDNYAMMVGDGEMLSSVAELVAAGLRCGVLREDQENAVTVAAVMLAVQDVRDLVEVCSAQLDYLSRGDRARVVYPAEVDRWYAFLRESHESVATLVEKANELATKHDLAPLRPLTATPVVLELRAEEIAAAEEQEQEQAVPTEEEGERCKVEETEKASPEGICATDEGSVGSSSSRRKSGGTVNQKGRGGQQEVSTTLSRRATGGRPATAVTTKPTAREKAAASGETLRTGLSRTGEVSPVASRKIGRDNVSDEDTELRRRRAVDDVSVRKKSDMSTLSAEEAPQNSRVAVKARSKANGREGGMLEPTRGNSVEKRGTDSDVGAARQPKVGRTLGKVEQQQPKREVVFSMVREGSSSVSQRAVKVRDTTKRQNAGGGGGDRQVRAGLKSHYTGDEPRTPPSVRRPRPASSVKSSTVRDGTRTKKAVTASGVAGAATAAAQSGMGTTERKGTSGAPSNKLKRTRRKNPTSGQHENISKGLHSAAPGRARKRKPSSTETTRAGRPASD